MEIGQSDEVGKVGEEVAGPLNFGALSLPRPDQAPRSNRAILGAVGGGLALGLAYQLGWRFGSLPLSHATGWTPEQADHTIDVIIPILGPVLWEVIKQLRQHMIKRRSNAAPLILVLEKRARRRPFHSSDSFSIWPKDHPKKRNLFPLLCFPLAGFLLFYGLKLPFIVDKILFLFVAMMCFAFALSPLRSVRHPLLLLDNDGLQVAKCKLKWAEVQKVEVEHLLDSNGSYSCTKWSIFDENSARRARVFLAAERCSQWEEEKMLGFVAQKLGSRMVSVSPLVAASGVISL